MQPNKFIRILILGFLLLAFPATGLAGGPKDSLISINEAVENGDEELFAELVDVDGILNQAMDMFIQEVGKPGNASYLPPMLALMFSQAAGQEQIRRLLLGETKAFVINGVASGAFAGKQFAPAQRQGVLAPLFADASTGRKEIRHMGDAVADGDGWLLPFTIHDYGNDHDYSVIGRFANANGKVRLIGVENLNQLFTQIRKEAFGE